MLLLIDNYDSFTYNLAQYFGELGATLLVKRNDEISVADIEALAPGHIVISPGPGRPEDAGISVDVIRRYGARIPVLGVCLGHQSIGQAFGAKVVRARAPVHGKAEEIVHDGNALFRGLPKPLRGGRYHSLVVDGRTVPKDLRISARTRDGIVMALRHRRLPVFGVQFHPESILTPDGQMLLRNFLEV
jgi:anthranilate synthase/aminodeoxychorismate synthase-like glutamine amidotransferase